MSNTHSDNERAIKAINAGLERTWDIFLNGSGNIRPGSVEAYGAIAGLREVKRERLLKLEEENSEEKE